MCSAAAICGENILAEEADAAAADDDDDVVVCCCFCICLAFVEKEREYMHVQPLNKLFLFNEYNSLRLLWVAHPSLLCQRSRR